MDDGSFVEYGSFAIAAQRRRRELDDLIRNTPADGLVGGLARVNGSLFPGDVARVAVASYDYTVLAGTQGQKNHTKKDRIFDVARQLRLPFILFAEGGGGRPGDTDASGVAGLDCRPCHDHGPPACPRGHFRCMRDLGIGDVQATLATVLAASA